MQSIESDKNKAGTALYKCPIEFDHVGLRTSFESSVSKIESGKEAELTLSEARAVRNLRTQSSISVTSISDDAPTHLYMSE